MAASCTAARFFLCRICSLASSFRPLRLLWSGPLVLPLALLLGCWLRGRPSRAACCRLQGCCWLCRARQGGLGHSWRPPGSCDEAGSMVRRNPQSKSCTVTPHSTQVHREIPQTLLCEHLLMREATGYASLEISVAATSITSKL